MVVISNGEMLLGPGSNVLYGMPEDVAGASGLRETINVKRRYAESEDAYSARVFQARQAEARRGARSGVDWDKVGRERVDLSKNKAPLKLPGRKATNREEQTSTEIAIRDVDVDSSAPALFGGLTITDVLWKGGILSSSLLGGGLVVLSGLVVAGGGTWLYQIITAENDINKAEKLLKTQEQAMKEWELNNGVTINEWTARRIMPHVRMEDYIAAMDVGNQVTLSNGLHLGTKFLAVSPPKEDNSNLEPVLVNVIPLTAEEKKQKPPNYVDPVLLLGFIERKRAYQVTIFLILAAVIAAKKIIDRRNGRSSRSNRSSKVDNPSIDSGRDSTGQ